MWFPDHLLAIETSCDETAAAVVRGRTVLSNVVASQAEMHAKWGGVVPEAAARAHVESIIPVIDEALSSAGRPDIKGVAVTNRPGLVGALSVGLTAAKALATAWDVPLVGVHHLEGHLLSPFVLEGPEPTVPALALTVSGGHTELVAVDAVGDYRLLGETLDDAAGEAFDKGARLLGLGYPGGRAVQECAKQGDPARYNLPRALPKDPYHWSFSGLKTAMLRLVEAEGDKLSVPDAAASLQAAVVDALAGKVASVLDEVGPRSFFLVGGVAANQSLRDRLAGECRRRGVEFWTPKIELCTDNAAMIGVAGSFRLARGERDTLDLDVKAGDPLPGLR
ncbi:MAG: tRNA (adenosine(37)-N6)-threonylcarbamoyltransferase complex transferase subunit TsaD [Fimbriimonadaceae bacterium]|nr:tRNA (adenosine(37)-N6)-threonylcarbamoyltransferase complex transferase subunit TsaD [Fimbriimonadaceae bacterium]